MEMGKEMMGGGDGLMVRDSAKSKMATLVALVEEESQ
jgi:hypothetical protein